MHPSAGSKKQGANLHNSHPTEYLRSAEADSSLRHSDRFPLGPGYARPVRGLALAADGVGVVGEDGVLAAGGAPAAGAARLVDIS